MILFSKQFDMSNIIKEKKVETNMESKGRKI